MRDNNKDPIKRLNEIADTIESDDAYWAAEIRECVATLSAPPPAPVAFLVERLSGNGYSPSRRVLDATQYDPRKLEFWVDEETQARHRVTPLYTSPQPVQAVAEAIPEELFDGYAVLNEIEPCKHVSADHVALVLDAVVGLIRKRTKA